MWDHPSVRKSRATGLVDAPPSFRCLDHDCHIASATAATVHAAVKATASASQIAAALRCGGSGSSSAGVGSSGRTSPSGGTCTCFISRSPRVGNTRRRRFTQSRARNHADLSRAGLQLKTRLSRRPAIEHILRRHLLTALPYPPSVWRVCGSLKTRWRTARASG